MNNRFNSEAKLPWSYDSTLANHIATNKSSANREMPLFSRLYPSFGYLRKIVPPRGLKYSLLLLLYTQYKMTGVLHMVHVIEYAFHGFCVCVQVILNYQYHLHYTCYILHLN